MKLFRNTDSPSVSTQGNLTGSKRKVKDTVADFYNIIQKWSRLRAGGSATIIEIANIKLKTM